MKLLHTADIHLGKILYGKKRYHEHEQFFNWLIEIISDQQIDILLIAGDIFDSAMPSNRAQQIYYEFLAHIRQTSCRHIVIIAGNHDSGSFLTAPKHLLKNMNIHIVGNLTGNMDEEIIALCDGNQQLEAIVCAVPYLREKDVRTVGSSESIEDKALKLQEGVAAHYLTICQKAWDMRDMSKGDVPIIVMGHLFTAGKNHGVGDGVRELYIGSIAHIPVSIFPEYIDYVALGHLHIAQSVDSHGKVRYSGSPIPLGFGELKKEKSVVIVDFTDTKTSIELLAVPCFQHLERIKGDWTSITDRLTVLIAAGYCVWVEIEYTGSALIADLSQQLSRIIENSQVEILRVKDIRTYNEFFVDNTLSLSLSDLTPHDVFEKFLDLHNIDTDQKEDLRLIYQEILREIEMGTALLQNSTE